MNTEDQNTNQAVAELELDSKPEPLIPVDPVDQTEPEPDPEAHSDPQVAEAFVLPPIDPIEPSEPDEPAKFKKPLNLPAVLLAMLVVILLGVIGLLLYDKYMPTGAEIKTIQDAHDTTLQKADDNVQAEVLEPTE